MSDLIIEPGTSSMTIYRSSDWGARASRVALISQSGDGTYAVDKVPVAAVNTVGLFSVLTCVDGTTHPVLSAFFRLVRNGPRPEDA